MEMSVVAAEDLSVPPQRTSSAESNFRLLDDAFLQTQARIWLGEVLKIAFLVTSTTENTQARIWLGEVLKIRFDEQINISDLLADGELLFEASEAISKMLPTLSMDDTPLRVYEWKSLTSNKSTRRYMPYYNVDSFLRMCKNLGMDGIDLFSPSDVVEKRNTRKVCMCLRSLSKKAKFRDVNVPDFDSVTCTLAMPTDKVEYIRKSLEMSQSSSSLSVEQEAEKALRVRFWRRMSNSPSALSNGFSDDYNEAESRFVVDESSDYAYDAEFPNILGSQVKMDDDDQCEYLSPSKDESVGSPSSQYYTDDDLNVSSSHCQGSRISGKVPEPDINYGYRNGDFSHVPLDWGDSHLGVGVYKDGNRNVDEVGSVSHDKEDTACSHCHPTGNNLCNEYIETFDDPSVDFDKTLELNEPPELSINGDFHAGEGEKVSHEESLICEVDPDVGKLGPHAKSNEDLSVELTEQSSISKSLGNPDFSENSEYHILKKCTELGNFGSESCSDGLFNGNASVEHRSGKLGFHEEKAPCSIDCDVQDDIISSLIAVKSCNNDNCWDHVRNADHHRESIPLLLEVDTIISEDISYSLINNGKEASGCNTISREHIKEHHVKGLTDENLILDIPQADRNSSPNVVPGKINTNCSKDYDDGMEGSNNHNTSHESVNGKPINIHNFILVDSVATSSCDLQREAQSPKNGNDTNITHQCVEEVDKGQSEVLILKQEGPDKELPVTKPSRKLLKSVVKGTALVGLAVFLLHLRNNRRENHSEAKKQPSRLVKHGTPKPLQKSGSIINVYPAEKLHLGI